MEKIKEVLRNFPRVGEGCSVEPWGAGHINDTYRVESSTGLFLLQRVNHHVFKDVEGMNGNIIRALTHFENSQKECGENRFEKMMLFPTGAHRYHWRDPRGDYWRVMNFIDHAHSVDVVETPCQAYEAAKAYAYFQRHLATCPIDGFIETIPGFHDLHLRLQQYDKALQEDVIQRAQGCKDELAFVASYRSLETTLHDLLESGRIPLRITHNDTKINNVLFSNQTGKGVAVVDLDTVMPGTVLYDFGDMMRTFLSPAAEDERDLSKVVFRQEIFDALLKGYMEELEGILTPTEREYLVWGGCVMTFMIGVRFLTDYLAGDVYYKTARPAHNLDRCRTQFRLLEAIMAHTH